MLDGYKEVFLSQFWALLQAGPINDVDLRIMVPLVSGLAEISAAKTVLEKAKEELSAEIKAFSQQIQFGIMIEVPFAALLADRLAHEVDFLILVPMT